MIFMGGERNFYDEVRRCLNIRLSCFLLFVSFFFSLNYLYCPVLCEIASIRLHSFLTCCCPGTCLWAWHRWSLGQSWWLRQVPLEAMTAHCLGRTSHTKRRQTTVDKIGRGRFPQRGIRALLFASPLIDAIGDL